MNKVDDKVIERIRKLLAMAADTSSPNEAAIAARRAEAMMRQHNIESAEAILGELKQPDSIVQQAAKGNIWRKKARSIPKWSQHMAVECANLFDCHAVQTYSGPDGWHIVFMGYRTDVTVCVWTYTYLLSQCKRFADRFAKDNPDVPRSASTAYHDGVSHGIIQGLAAALREKEQAARTHSTSTALVVAKRAAVEDKYGPVNYAQKNVKVNDVAAYLRGLTDGRTVNVNPGAIGHDAPNSPQLKG